MKQIVKLDAALKYMLAGNSEFTVTSLNTGRKFTYKLVSKNLWGKNPTYTALVINSIMLEDLAGAVYLDTETNKLSFRETEDGLFGASSIEVTSLLFILNKLRVGKIDIPIEIESDGRCGKCRKILESDQEFENGLCTKCTSVK